jgi:hypothetical protein
MYIIAHFGDTKSLLYENSKTKLTKSFFVAPSNCLVYLGRACNGSIRTPNSESCRLTIIILFQNHWFTYNEKMSIESVTQAVCNLALQFGDDDAGPGAMVCVS